MPIVKVVRKVEIVKSCLVLADSIENASVVANNEDFWRKESEKIIEQKFEKVENYSDLRGKYINNGVEHVYLEDIDPLKLL